MITTTTGTVNATDLVARKLNGERLVVGGGYVLYLHGWGVYNTAQNAWITFKSCEVTAGKAGQYTARIPYVLDTKRVAKEVATGGLVDGRHEWISL